MHTDHFVRFARPALRIAVILAHGDLTVTPAIEDLVRQADLIVAADGGVLHALAHGWQPHLLVGDLDSTPPEVRRQVEERGTRVLQYSPYKDETDTELALRAALAEGANEIYLLGVIGDRLDHSLANILLLALPETAQVRVMILAGRQRILAIRGQAELEGREGDLVSLLPIGGDVTGIWTTGLGYPLRGETLPFGTPRGVSNFFTAPKATVRVGSGILLAIITPL